MLGFHGISEQPISAQDVSASGEGVGVAAGTSTAMAVAPVEAIGSAAGTSTALGVGHSIGSAAGTSTATAVAGGSEGVGAAAGTSTVTAVGTTVLAGVGSSTGTSTVTGEPGNNGTITGTSAATAVGRTYIEYTQTYQEHFRVAEDALAVYEMFVGVDTEPDFDSAPAATSLTLPFTYTPPAPGAGTSVLHIVVRKRNVYNLQSFNVFETLKVIDTGGNEVLNEITIPLNLTTYDDVSGSIRVIASYDKTNDPSPADEWEVYASVGVDPIPGTDVPVATPVMIFLGDQAVLQQVISGYTAGQVVHIIATAIRTSDSARGSTLAVQHTVPASLDLVEGTVFGGTAYKEGNTVS